MIKTVTAGVVGMREHFYQEVSTETLFGDLSRSMFGQVLPRSLNIALLRGKPFCYPV